MQHPQTITTAQPSLMETILHDPKYKGKHVIVVDGQVFTANTGDGEGRILEQVRREHPRAIPEVAYIPEADTLIL